jgi:hypothetical protein
MPALIMAKGCHSPRLYHRLGRKATTERDSERRGLPKTQRPCYDVAAQGEGIVKKQPDSRVRLVCGIENQIGLKLRVYTDDEGHCIARFRPKPEHQGYPGHLHGGIISR